MTNSASQNLDRVLVLEMVRVTEAAAIAASKLIGRGDEKAADAAARGYVGWHPVTRGRRRPPGAVGLQAAGGFDRRRSGGGLRHGGEAGCHDGHGGPPQWPTSRERSHAHPTDHGSGAWGLGLGLGRPAGAASERAAPRGLRSRRRRRVDPPRPRRGGPRGIELDRAEVGIGKLPVVLPAGRRGGSQASHDRRDGDEPSHAEASPRRMDETI